MAALHSGEPVPGFPSCEWWFNNEPSLLMVLITVVLFLLWQVTLSVVSQGKDNHLARVYHNYYNLRRYYTVFVLHCIIDLFISLVVERLFKPVTMITLPNPLCQIWKIIFIMFDQSIKQNQLKIPSLVFSSAFNCIKTLHLKVYILIFFNGNMKHKMFPFKQNKHLHFSLIISLSASILYWYPQ